MLVGSALGAVSFNSPETYAATESTDGSTLAISSGNIISLTNLSRRDNGLSPLTENPTLDAAAQAKADHMLRHAYFAHTAPDGATPWSFFAEAQYEYVKAGENLAIDFDDCLSMHEAWLASGSHRANILDTFYTEIGVGVARGEFEGRETTLVAVFMGLPENGLPAAVGQGSQESISQTDASPTTEDLQTVSTSTGEAVAGEQSATGSLDTAQPLPEQNTVSERTANSDSVLLAYRKNQEDILIREKEISRLEGQASFAFFVCSVSACLASGLCLMLIVRSRRQMSSTSENHASLLCG
ncbi:MAG TPA: CAP domain-containing protein [bacterium]|nr:CAP domain-containing protein [bacterium]